MINILEALYEAIDYAGELFIQNKNRCRDKTISDMSRDV